MPHDSSERRKIYNQRLESGICPRCGGKKAKGYKFVYCDDCRLYFRNYNNEQSEKLNETRKIKYNQRKMNRQCPRCGKKLLKRYKKTICAECLEKQYSYNQGLNITANSLLLT